MEKKEKIVYILTYAGEDPERATLPFILATGALAMDVKATIILQGSAVFLAKKDYVEHILACGLKPLKELMIAFLEMGGRLLVCQPCINERKIGVDDLIEGAKPTGAGEVTKEILDAHATLVY